ncbi:hypothetical protein RRG08_045435 [Elysia crispata]|uniref:Uncharacterized protein n=1 Tax=Elysia crispata TaxID=231223 RepID=A0AAE1AXB6_9GAST|nr:hypothetical protein RRG08_045435 [Elysia crispata]
MGNVTVWRPACRTREVGAMGIVTVRRGQEEGRVGMRWKQSALINDSLLIREREENSIRFAAGSPKLQAREGMHLMRWDLEDSLPPLPPPSVWIALQSHRSSSWISNRDGQPSIGPQRYLKRLMCFPVFEQVYYSCPTPFSNNSRASAVGARSDVLMGIPGYGV